MESCKKLIGSCFIGRRRSTIAVVLVMLIAIGLVARPRRRGRKSEHWEWRQPQRQSSA